MDALNAILPVFLVVAVGFVAVRSGYIPFDVMRPIGVVVLRIALPALIFLSVAAAPSGQGLHFPAVLAIGAGSLATFASGLLAAHWLLRLPRPAAAMVGLGVSASNSGFLGYPIMQGLMGTVEAGRVLAHMMIVENLIIIPLALVLSNDVRTGAGAMRNLLRDLARNPLVVALGLALAFRLSGLAIPDQGLKTLEFLARMAAPAALLVVGATLAGLRPEGQTGAVLLILFGKLLVHPFLILIAFAAIVATDDNTLQLGAILMGAMPMISIYPLLCQRSGFAAVASTAMFGATVLGVVTITGWMHLLGAGGF